MEQYEEPSSEKPEGRAPPPPLVAPFYRWLSALERWWYESLPLWGRVVLGLGVVAVAYYVLNNV